MGSNVSRRLPTLLLFRYGRNTLDAFLAIRDTC